MSDLGNRQSPLWQWYTRYGTVCPVIESAPEEFEGAQRDLFERCLREHNQWADNLPVATGPQGQKGYDYE
jgi:hypothetical protein